MPSNRYSRAASPDRASDPPTVTARVAASSVAVTVGAPVSTLTVRLTSADWLPAASVARPVTTVSPCAETGTSTNRASGVAVHAPAPTRVSIVVRYDVSSSAATRTVTGEENQPSSPEVPDAATVTMGAVVSSPPGSTVPPTWTVATR